MCPCASPISAPCLRSAAALPITAASCCPDLAQQVELTLYTADPQQIDAQIRTQFEVRDLHHFAQDRRQFDLPLYQMGNSEYHDAFYPTLLRYPGLVVLHDYLIHQFIAYRSLEQDDFTGYAREMGYALGAQGMQLAHAIRLGQAPPASFAIPLNDRLLDSSLGLIVHSAYVADKIRAAGFERPLAIIPALIEEHAGQSRRAVLGLADDAPLFASFGVITQQKQIEMALNAFRDLRETVPEAHYLLVGEALPEVDPQAMIARSGARRLRHANWLRAQSRRFCRLDTHGRYRDQFT